MPRQLGITTDQGQINDQANMCIGRFLNLAIMNMMGYYVKSNRMGTFGYPMAWCLSADDSAYQRVGWQPYHVQQGYGLNESAVTVTSALMWGNNMAPSTLNAHKIMELIAWDCAERGQCALGSSQQFTPRTILLTEPVAKVLSKEFTSLAQLEDSLILYSRRPVKERAFANLYANTGGGKDDKYNMNQYTRHIEQAEGGQSTPTAPWYDRTEATIKTVATMRKDSTVFIITGDTARNKVQVMPGGAWATASVEVPDAWDSIMSANGYPTLESMYLDDKNTATSNVSAYNEDKLPVHQSGSTIVNENNARMGIFDASGKMVASTTGNYNMQNLPEGVYMVRISGYQGACKVINQ